MELDDRCRSVDGSAAVDDDDGSAAVDDDDGSAVDDDGSEVDDDGRDGSEQTPAAADRRPWSDDETDDDERRLTETIAEMYRCGGAAAAPSTRKYDPARRVSMRSF